MTSPYAFTEEELKMMDKNYKKPKVYIFHQGCCHNVDVIVFRLKSGLCQRKRWLSLKTLFMSEAQLPLKTNKGCQKRLLIFCKLINHKRLFNKTNFFFEDLRAMMKSLKKRKRSWTNMRNQNLCQLSFTAQGLSQS